MMFQVQEVQNAGSKKPKDGWRLRSKKYMNQSSKFSAIESYMFVSHFLQVDLENVWQIFKVLSHFDLT